MKAARTQAQIAAATAAQWFRIAEAINAASGIITSTGVARALGSFRSHVSHHLAEMHRAELLDYTQMSSLGRPRSWRLTDKGRRLLANGGSAIDRPALPEHAAIRYDAAPLTQAFGMRLPPMSVPARRVEFK